MSDDHDVRALAADAVVAIDGEVLLMERDTDPSEGRWVLARRHR